jgi:NDP-sugar pyrophosphorylase family protein
MRIEVSREEVLLDTGGGLKKAAWFFLEGEERGEPFIMHNVDVISSIDLGRMVRFHMEQKALATLAVQARPTSRPLLFGKPGQFRGRATPGVSEPPGMQALAFAGIHVISPRIFEKITEQGVFSIIDSYIRLAGQGERIAAFRADEYYWRDLGRAENVAQAERDMESGTLSFD